MATEYPTPTEKLIIYPSERFSGKEDFDYRSSVVEVSGFIIQNTTREYGNEDGIALTANSNSGVIVLADGHFGTFARDIVLRVLPKNLHQQLIFAQSSDVVSAVNQAQRVTQQEIVNRRHEDDNPYLDGAVYSAVQFQVNNGDVTARIIVPGDCEIHTLSNVDGKLKKKPYVYPKHLYNSNNEELSDKIQQAIRDNNGKIYQDEYGRFYVVKGDGMQLYLANSLGDEDAPGVNARQLTEDDVKEIKCKRGDYFVLFSDGLPNNFIAAGREFAYFNIYNIIANSGAVLEVIRGASPTIQKRLMLSNKINVNENALRVGISNLPIEVRVNFEKIILQYAHTEKAITVKDDLELARDLSQLFIAEIMKPFGKKKPQYSDDISLVITRVPQIQTC